MHATLAGPGEIAAFSVPAIHCADSLSPSHRIMKERHYHFDPDVLRARGNVYLQGYWQSEKYFKDIEDLIKTELALETRANAQNTIMAGRIRSSKNSVSVHVRRGDYVTDVHSASVHGVLDVHYYVAATEYLRQQVHEPVLFVFSDEPGWCKAHLSLGCPTVFVDVNSTDHAYEDLRLMSLCRHHIIANSSYSWWGAWLGAASDKIVCAPTMWFRRKEVNTEDLLPASWVRF